jgi:CubicO group peptidase (beta-lactamase class C family)
MHPYFLFTFLVLIFSLTSHLASATEAISLKGAERAFAYSRSHGGIALLIKQGNSVLLEKYNNGGSPVVPNVAFSMTKSLCGLMAMAAEAEKIFSLDEKVSGTLCEWRKDSLKEQITVRQLLNQTSGLSSGYHSLYSNHVQDKSRAALQIRRLCPPGTAFLYGPSHWEVFEEFLRRKLKSRGITPLAYLRQKVLIVCGGNISGWRMDRSGKPYFSTGAILTARQLAKIGDLLLNSGRFGFFQLIPQDGLVALSKGTPANPMYSMGFWLNRASELPCAEEVVIEQRIGGGYSAPSWKKACISKYAPADLIAMVGSRGQRLYVIPSRRLVIARQGMSENFRDSEFLRLLLN